MTDKTKKPINHKVEISKGYFGIGDEGPFKYAAECSCGFYRSGRYEIAILFQIERHLKNRLYNDR